MTMDEKELDQILNGAGHRWNIAVSSAVAELVDSTRVHTIPPEPARKKLPRGVVWGIFATAAVLVTAGASVTAIQMGIPPFQSLEAGLQRTTTAITVNYVEAGGTAVTCNAFIEFRQLDAASEAKIESYISTQDWSGFGQDLFDTAEAQATPSSTVSSRLADAIDTALFEKTGEVLPGIVHGPADTTGVIFNGHSMSCSAQSE